MLRWGRPETAEGGEVGRGARGKVRERARGGGVKGVTGWVGGGRSYCYYVIIIIKIFENICDIKILMIISKSSIFENCEKFCFCLGKNKIEFLEKKI